MANRTSLVSAIPFAVLLFLLNSAMPRAVAQPIDAAAEPAPATAPTTAPSTIPADQTTPRGAIKMLSQAMDAGDGPTILAIFAAETETEQRMAKAMSELAVAIAKLKQAAAEAYGTDGSAAFGGAPPAMRDALARLETATEQIDGDTAIITLPGGQTFTVRREEGAWKLPMNEITRGNSPEAIEQGIENAILQAKLHIEVADEIKAGRFRGAMEARESLAQRVMQVAIQRRAASTQEAAPSGAEPTTVPAPAP